MHLLFSFVHTEAITQDRNRGSTVFPEGYGGRYMEHADTSSGNKVMTYMVITWL